VGPTETAVFLHHHPIGLALFILGGVVVALLAFFAGESNSGPHGLISYQILPI
jgi:hypothetical protein